MKIHIGIPTDVDEFRVLVEEVVRRIAADSSDGEKHLPKLEIVEGMGGPSSAALDPHTDVFLGLGWLKLDPEGPGSLPDLQAARERWRGSGRKAWLLYRCIRVPGKLDEIDGGALDNLRGLFHRLRSEGQDDLLYREFETGDQLAELLEKDLSSLRKSIAKRKERPAEKAKTSESELATALHPGEAYEMSFLSVGVGKLPTDEDRRQDVSRLRRALRELVEQTASSYGGATLRWAEDEGLVAFWRKRRRDSAVMTALKVLHSMPVFNLDLENNPLPDPVRIRMAVHDTAIVFSLPLQSIEAEGIETTVEMQRDHTEPGELTVTKSLMARLDPRLRTRFTSRGMVGQEPTFGCHLPSVELAPEQATLEEISSRFERQKKEALHTLETLSSDSDLGQVAGALDSAYSTLNHYSAGFGRLDSSWSSSFLDELESSTGTLLEHEFELWSLLRKTGKDAGPQLAAAIKATSRRRARSVAILEKLLERMRPVGKKEVAGIHLDERLQGRIHELLRADALDSETILTDLLLHRRAGLIEFLSTRGKDERHGLLLDKLWTAADLLVLDDVISIRGHRRSSDLGILSCLAGGPISDHRFALIERLLTQETVHDLKVACEAAGMKPGEDDLQIVGRCLVLGHADGPTRSVAAKILSQSSMWQALSLPDVPIASLYAIGERIHRSENEDAKKIFFDCVRTPMLEAIEASREREEIEALAALTLLMIEDPFLVEGGYFERFDALVQALQARAQEMGVHLEYFEALRRTLEQARKEEGRPGRLPAGVRQLPLTLQRRLAADPIYLLWFVTHPDPRIAGETIHHIGLSNVERVLRLREISGVVMQALMKRPELFTRSETLLTALGHPKCEQRFAAHHIPGLARSARGKKTLESLARNPSAHPAVRALARQAAMGRRRS